MVSLRSARTLLLLGLAGLAIGVPVLEVAAKPKPAVVEAPPPPPPPPPIPDIGMSGRLVSQAAAFEGFMRRASSISPAFVDGNSVAQSLRAGAASEPHQLLRGEVAYAALAALQDPTFVATIRTVGATPEGRYSILSKLFSDPANVFAYKGADRAAGLAKAALAGDGMRLFNAGKAVKQAAYDVQRQSWSLGPVADPEGRSQAVKDLSRASMPVDSDELGVLQRAATGDPDMGLTADPAPPPYSPLLTHAVALAALAAIGQAGDDQVENLNWLFDSYFTDHCLAEAKLALYECLAVAKPHYEDVFCLGQHAMTDTASCIVRGAGSAVPLEILTRPISIAPVHRGAHPAHHHHA